MQMNPRLWKIGALGVTLGALATSAYAQDQSAAAQDQTPAEWNVIQSYCTDCHNFEDWAGSIAFDVMSPDSIPHDAKVWEDVIRKLKGGLMPPPGKKRPDAETVMHVANWLETTIDTEAAHASQYVGRIPLHRINRREYEYAIRDLLGLDVDASSMLPADDVKDGFDNNAAALQVSPAFIDQYLNAARTIAHQAIGDTRPIPIMQTYGNVADMIISLPPRGIDGEGSQQRHTQGLPFGTRGGMSVEHNFMADGEYELTIGDLALAREVPNMEFENTVVALLDGKEFFRTTVGGEKDHRWIDQILDDAVASINDRLRKIHFHATAGQHTVTVTFVQKSMAESDERFRISALEGGQDRVHGVHALQIRGPLNVDGISQTASRKKIFTCYPDDASEEEACARQIVSNLAEQAFRRPLTETDVTQLMAFYDASREKGDFEKGIEDALSAILVSPHFIYRAEDGLFAGDSQNISDIELASRLSFFLWSSLPDDELMTLAEAEKLSQPAVLNQQIDRMLKDDRARALVNDFSSQWLNLARLDEIAANGSLFRYATRSLDPRKMFKTELSLFLDSVLRSDQSVLRLIDADYTFLNERLAMHYGIEDVKGSRFRKVHIDNPARRGLLGKGAILMLTSTPVRTSPVIRGEWIMERLLGTPPAAPPPGIPALTENRPGQVALTVRERMEQHRADPACNSCHGVIDPLGLALENFNAVGQFQKFDHETQTLIDASGELPDGTAIKGPEDLDKALMARKDMFVQTLTEKLMTYALGREVDYRDMPEVRRIVANAAKDDYRFAALVREIVHSDAFMKRENYLVSSPDADEPQQASAKEPQREARAETGAFE